MSEENGIVSLEELPLKEFYLELEPHFIELIETKIAKKWKIEEFANILNVNHRILSHWLKKESLLRLDIFEKIIKFFGIKESNVSILGFRGKNGKVIRYPKFPFDFNTKNGVRIIAAILGDGSLSISPSYSNKNKNLIYGFIEDCQIVFGNLELNYRPKEKGSDVKVVDLPRIFGKILKVVGLKLGSKVENNPHIPFFIFNLEKERILEFLSQIIDDEGSVSIASRHLSVELSTLANYSSSNLVDDLEKLFLKIGIESAIYPGIEYNSKRGEKRRKWKIEIHSFKQLEYLYSALDLRNSIRKNKLLFLIQNKKVDQFPKKKTHSIYFNTMKTLTKEKGYFSSEDLVERIPRSKGHIRNMILKFSNNHEIIKIQPIISDGKKFYSAHYKVN